MPQRLSYENMVLLRGIEPPTPSLPMTCSTPELQQRKSGSISTDIRFFVQAFILLQKLKENPRFLRGFSIGNGHRWPQSPAHPAAVSARSIADHHRNNATIRGDARENLHLP